MKQKIFFKVFISICLVLSIFSGVAFGATYDANAMVDRNYVYDDAGNAYVKYGEPVICEPTGTGIKITESYQDANGNCWQVDSNGFYTFGYDSEGNYINISEGIVTDADGKTGNTREAFDITLEDSVIPGDNTNKMTVDVKVNVVIADGENFSNPQATIEVHTGDVMTKQTAIDMINQTGQYDAWLPNGESEWTIELYEQVVGEMAAKDPAMRSAWDYLGTVMNDLQFMSKAIVDGVFNAVTGQLEYIITVDGNIYCITELGLDGEMVQLFMDNKLYKVNGEDKNAEDAQDPDDPDSDDPDSDPDDSDPTPTIPGTPGQWSDMGMASVSANVWSDKYNVSTAIPTSENVNGSISASDMSWYYNVKKAYDSQDYTIDSVTLYWDPYWVWVDDGYTYTTSTGVEVFVKTGQHQEIRYASSTTESVTGSYTTHYFAVAEAHMNRLGGGSVSNDAVGTLASLGAAGIGGSISRDGGIIFYEDRMDKSSFSAYGETYGGALGQAQAVIRQRIRLSSKIKNDTLVIKSAVLWGITENWGDEFKATPYQEPSHLVSPSSSTMSSSGTKMIPSNKQNGSYASHASASYPMVPGFDGQGTYSKGATPPNVFVWTPVVNNSTLTPEAFVNQKVSQSSGVKYIQLDKKFTITIPHSGTHISVQGYGSRNYNSYQAVPGSITNWGKIKDVKLPFDAYLVENENKLTFIKAGTWLSDHGLATAGNTYTFLVPVWAEEGTHAVTTRVVAENIISYANGSSCPAGLVQDGANLSYTRYVAEKTIQVEIVGKIYDLRIQGTNDPGWPGVKGENGAYITSPEFPFGQANQNSMPQYKFAPKLGYVVEFDFKTKGVKTDNVDVDIQPEGFYFIGKNGGTAQEVDLYFQVAKNQYVKIATGTNNSDIIVNLSNKFMRVLTSELIDSNRIMRQQVGVFYTYAENVLIGKLPNLNIPEKLRLCYNNFTEYVNSGLYKNSQATIEGNANGGLSYSAGKYDKVTNGKDTVIASVGHWYAGYRLPSTTVAVPKGTTASQIVNNPNLIKKNGYILVKFDIVGKNGNEDYLRYTGPESISEPGTYEDDKQWQDPQGNPDPSNPNQPTTLPNGKPGTIPDGIVIMFETDLKANNDYEVIGTH